MPMQPTVAKGLIRSPDGDTYKAKSQKMTTIHIWSHFFILLEQFIVSFLYCVWELIPSIGSIQFCAVLIEIKFFGILRGLKTDLKSQFLGEVYEDPKNGMPVDLAKFSLRPFRGGHLFQIHI